MRSDWLFDAVQAEVAYRTEELHKAGRSKWVGRVGGVRRRARARRADDVEVPAQERRQRERSAPAPEPTR